jgi:hypothetical protein
MRPAVEHEMLPHLVAERDQIMANAGLGEQ